MNETTFIVIGLFIAFATLIVAIMQYIKKNKTAKKVTTVTSSGAGDAVNGDKAGRDYYRGDKIDGDKVGGDKIQGKKVVHHHNEKS